MSNELIKQLQEKRLRAWEAAKAINDATLIEGRDGTFQGEEEAAWQKANADMASLDQRMAEIIDAEKRAANAEEALGSFKAPPPVTAPESRAMNLEKQVRSFLTGDPVENDKGQLMQVRSVDINPERPYGINEFRTLSKLSAAAGANTVKTSFYDQLMAHLIEVSGILMAGPTVLQTNSGEAIQIPKTTAHSTSTLTAEAGTIAASDPTFGQVTLNAYKYPTLIQVSNELISDTSVDLLGYLAMQAGRAVGNAFGAHAITGTGSSQPNGIVTAATLGVTGGAGVTGAFTGDNLIDLFFSVIAPYRNSPSCGWILKDSSLATARKIKDTTNQYLWQPGLVGGAPDTLLGKPVYTDPNVAAVGLSAKSVVFGDISQYFVRMVGGIRFERSDDFAFNTDLVTFRCIMRADGNLVDTTGAVKYFAGNAA